MSLVAEGRHYFRDDSGSEHLHDLKSDPYEKVNLVNSEAGKRLVGLYRKMLLDALTANPGSREAETAYLKTYRQWLKSTIEGSRLAERADDRPGHAMKRRSCAFGGSDSE